MTLFRIGISRVFVNVLNERVRENDLTNLGTVLIFSVCNSTLVVCRHWATSRGVWWRAQDILFFMWRAATGRKLIAVSAQHCSLLVVSCSSGWKWISKLNSEKLPLFEKLLSGGLNLVSLTFPACLLLLWVLIYSEYYGHRYSQYVAAFIVIIWSKGFVN